MTAGVRTGRSAPLLHSSWGSALGWQPATQLLWLVCCLVVYVLAVAPLFAYSGLIMAPQSDATKLVFAAVALTAFSFLLPRRLASPADYVIVMLFDVSLVPFYAYWFLSNQPWWQGCLVTAYWCVVLLVDRFPFHPRLRHVKGAQGAAFLVAWGLVVTGGVLILSTGHVTLGLSLADVYTVRAVWAAEASGISGYVVPWLAYAILPALLAHAWQKRRFGELLVLICAAYMLFAATGAKTFLFMPIVVVGVMLIAAWHPAGSLVPIALGGLVAVMVFMGSVSGSPFWVSLGIRRLLFVPARLTSVYLDFFSKNPVVRLSGSVLRGWIRFPYPMNVPRMIGEALGQPGTNANNGLAADGFANFGIVGVLVWAVALGVLIRLLRAATERRENRPEAWAVTAMWPVILLSSALTTSLLTHGLALGLLAAWSLRPDRHTIESRRNGQARGIDAMNQSQACDMPRATPGLVHGRDATR